MDPSTAGEPTRPWRQFASSASTDPPPQSPSALASLTPVYFAKYRTRAAQSEPATYDLEQRRWDAETRRLDAKLDAMIRQGERDAKDAGDQLKAVSLENEGEAIRPAAPAAPLTPVPQENEMQTNAGGSAAGQGPAPTT